MHNRARSIYAPIMSLNQLVATAVARPNPNSCFRLTGPSNDTIYAENPYGGEQFPLYRVETSKSKPNIRVLRILPNGDHRPFATVTLSSMTTSIATTIHGQDIKLTYDMNSMSGARNFSAAGREFKWRTKNSGDGYELLDKNKNKVALYKMDALGSKSKAKLEIYVAGDDIFIDTIVATVMATMAKDSKDGKEMFKAMRVVMGGF